jgi:hypothetical protein
VVQGLVVTRRAMSPPLLQHTAAEATSRAPRRAADVAGSRRVALLPRLLPRLSLSSENVPLTVQ